MAFRSFADNLVPGDTNGSPDIFVFDTQAASVERVSVTGSGAQANNWSGGPAISSDGRYVAFQSDANNLVSSDTNSQGDIFLRDRQTGTTTRVSVSGAGAQGNGGSRQATISGDGRYVGFASDAGNLVASDTNGVADVFVRDTQTSMTHRLSTASDGTQANGGSSAPNLSMNGRYIVFVSDATNLVAGDTNNQADIFKTDLLYQALNATPTPTPAAGTGTGLRGDYFNTADLSGVPLLTRLDPRVDFSWGIGAPVWGGNQDHFSMRWSGQVQPRYSEDYTFRVLSDDGARLWINGNLVIDDWNARGLASRSTAPIALAAGQKYDLVLEYFENVDNAEVHLYWSSFSQSEEPIATSQLYAAVIPTPTPTRTAPAPTLIERISLDSAGVQADGASDWPSISDDGRLVAYQSVATNLVPGDTNDRQDIFLYDRGPGITTRLSLGVGGAQSIEYSDHPALSAGGDYATFRSWSSNMVPGFTGWVHIFGRDLAAGTNQMLDVSSSGEQADCSGDYASLSADGRYAAFQACASNLTRPATAPVRFTCATCRRARRSWSATTTRARPAGARASIQSFQPTGNLSSM